MTKKQIEQKAKEFCKEDVYGCNECCEECVQEIEKQKMIDLANWALSHQWVSVEDELPPLEKKVLVKHKYGFQTAARFPYYDIRPDETFWGLNSEMPIGADITHWMHIPLLLAEEGGKQ